LVNRILVVAPRQGVYLRNISIIPGRADPGKRRLAMTRLAAIAATLMLFASQPSAAQTAGTSMQGAASSLGTMNPLAPIGGTGIPLGATELSVDGVSPLAGPSATSCAGGSHAIAGTSNLFDGGGLANGCSAAQAGNAAMSGAVMLSPGSISGASIGATPSAGSLRNIPLGATELGTPGISGPISVPLPGVSSTSCPGVGGVHTGIAPGLGSGSSTVGSGATGMSLSFGC
jgi:hypothetical protein